MKEVWKSILGYEGLYSVSTKGQVRSDRKNIILKPSNNGGYRQVVLQNNAVKLTRKIHGLVAKTFLDNPNSYTEVNHKDGNKANNHLSNLEWCSRSENSLHAVAMGLQKRGEKLSFSKLKDQDIIPIREYHSKGLDFDTLGNLYGVNRKTIIDVINKRTWKHI